MSDRNKLAASGVSGANPFAPPDTKNHIRSQYRKPRFHRVAGVVLALAGAGTLALSLRYFLFHPMTETDEFIGPRLWVVGSCLLGGGLTLAVARPWIAVLVGFVSPVLTFGMAKVLYLLFHMTLG